jgi:hypothetical protein
MRTGTLLSLAAWVLAVYYTDPEKEGIVGELIFYFTLFLLLSGIFILMLSYLRRKLRKDGAVFSDLGISFREGMLLSLLSIILLILQSFRFLTWWDGLLAVAGIFLAELYFLTR